MCIDYQVYQAQRVAFEVPKFKLRYDEVSFLVKVKTSHDGGIVIDRQLA